MARFRSWNPDCKVYVGNLQDNCLKSDVESAFSKFGPLKNVWVARNPPGFAFVEFEDSRDAEDAVRSLDGTYVMLLYVGLLIKNTNCFIAELVVPEFG